MEQIILNYKKLNIILCLMETAPCSLTNLSSLFFYKIIIIIHMLDIYHIIILFLKQKRQPRIECQNDEKII